MKTVAELLEAGVHFGHRISRWNPKMKPYIHGRRNLIHIIDLKETIRGLIYANKFLTETAKRGGRFLYVATKRQARPIVEAEAARSQAYLVTERWLGGTLTNFSTIKSRQGRLVELEQMEQDGTIRSQSKKQAAALTREMRKLRRNLGGIREMDKLPDGLIVVDARRERNAIHEAQIMKIPVICLLDTDCDPDEVDIPIPGNDDAIRAIQLIIGELTDAVVAGKAQFNEAEAVRLREQDAVVSAAAAPAPPPAAPPAAPTPAPAAATTPPAAPPPSPTAE